MGPRSQVVPPAPAPWCWPACSAPATPGSRKWIRVARMRPGPSSPLPARISRAATMARLPTDCGRGVSGLGDAPRLASRPSPWTGGSKPAGWRWWPVLLRRWSACVTCSRALTPCARRGRRPRCCRSWPPTPMRSFARPWPRHRTSATRCRCIWRTRNRWPSRFALAGVESPVAAPDRSRRRRALARGRPVRRGGRRLRPRARRSVHRRAALGLGAARERLQDSHGACAAYRRAAAGSLAVAMAERARLAIDRLACPPG